MNKTTKITSIGIVFVAVIASLLFLTYTTSGTYLDDVIPANIFTEYEITTPEELSKLREYLEANPKARMAPMNNDFTAIFFEVWDKKYGKSFVNSIHKLMDNELKSAGISHADMFDDRYGNPSRYELHHKVFDDPTMKGFQNDKYKLDMIRQLLSYRENGYAEYEELVSERIHQMRTDSLMKEYSIDPALSDHMPCMTVKVC